MRSSKIIGSVRRGVLLAWHTLVVLGLRDFLGLIITWCLTRPPVVVAVAVQRVLFGECPPVWTVDSKPRGIVFLVPGYTYTGSQMIMLARRLHRRGFIVISARVPRNGNTLDYAKTVGLNQTLLATAAMLKRRHQCALIFLGISYGGCCAARMAAVLRHDHGITPDRLLLVQSPVRGTRLAQFGDFPAAAQMGIDHMEVAETLRLLYTLEQAGVHVKYFCAFFDEVTRRRDARPPIHGVESRWAHTLAHIGHWGTLQNPFVLQELTAYLVGMTKEDAASNETT